MRLLLGARARTERADCAGFRPLDLALRNGHSNSEVVALLVQEAQAHAERARTVLSPRAAFAAAAGTTHEGAIAPSLEPTPAPTTARAPASARSRARDPGRQGLPVLPLRAVDIHAISHLFIRLL